MTSTYTNAELDIPHDDLKMLVSEGKAVLGIDNDVAMKLQAAGHGPKKGTADYATYLFTWLAFGVFAASIYYSFVDRWWWFIVGFFAMNIIWRSVKSSTPKNYLDAALWYEEFYERVRPANVWIYQMSENDAAPYLRQEQ
ncbi:hypothetical protein C1J05_09980 [Sulfitobacter sp. JL08]|uniref:hypothetical protein n=1 Tax=Sulfitobacter sp. JL08 TaxID=2070369 RepID=UPI000E0C6783|nr:hypothetical protein [Sulfitobacter sp. JL08]AXI54782.1 hypothetical protein C1J05_09980 [Sulfitobacter sp. JL08]